MSNRHEGASAKAQVDRRLTDQFKEGSRFEGWNYNLEMLPAAELQVQPKLAEWARWQSAEQPSAE